jgi:hypothetical protein
LVAVKVRASKPAIEGHPHKDRNSVIGAVEIDAMVTLIKADAWFLIMAARLGRTPLLAAAESMKKRARLIKSYQQSDPVDREAFGESVGVETAWDEVLVPNLS